MPSQTMRRTRGTLGVVGFTFDSGYNPGPRASARIDGARAGGMDKGRTMRHLRAMAPIKQARDMAARHG